MPDFNYLCTHHIHTVSCGDTSMGSPGFERPLKRVSVAAGLSGRHTMASRICMGLQWVNIRHMLE